MTYAMSDIHGCYDEYLEALRIIDFKDEDTLFVVGDVIDRGKEPIKLLMDMLYRPNVYPILGNHEYYAITVLNKLGVEITDESIARLTNDDIEAYMHWIKDGGQNTIEQFRRLNKEDREAILSYLDEFSLYYEIRVNDYDYVLVHAGFEPFIEGKSLDEYLPHEMIFKTADYNKVYFKDKYLITGHTPTLALHGDNKGRIFEYNNHIAIDCGCVFGGNLGIYCLDNKKSYYVKYKGYN